MAERADRISGFTGKALVLDRELQSLKQELRRQSHQLKWLEMTENQNFWTGDTDDVVTLIRGLNDGGKSRQG